MKTSQTHSQLSQIQHFFPHSTSAKSQAQFCAFHQAIDTSPASPATQSQAHPRQLHFVNWIVVLAAD